MLLTFTKPGFPSAWLWSRQMKELMLLQGQEPTWVPHRTAFTTKQLSWVEIGFKRQRKQESSPALPHHYGESRL